jgi:hypothetical protein
MSGSAKSIRTIQMKRIRRDRTNRASWTDVVSHESVDKRRTAISPVLGIGDGDSDNDVWPNPRSAAGHDGAAGDRS